MSRRWGFHSGKMTCNDAEFTGETTINHATGTDFGAAQAQYTIPDGKYIIGLKSTSNSGTATIPSSYAKKGKVLIINDEGNNATTNNIEIATESTEKIDGATTATISTSSGTLALYSDGTDFFTF